MENPIILSWLNDFIFCPVSIYFHQLYGDQDKMLYQCKDQINGTNAHLAIDKMGISFHFLFKTSFKFLLL